MIYDLSVNKTSAALSFLEKYVENCSLNNSSNCSDHLPGLVFNVIYTYRMHMFNWKSP